MDNSRSYVTRGGRLFLNAGWNLLSTGAPLLVALFAVPILIDGLGVARFGVLTVAWMIVGYFSLFDLGLGRALTKLVAEKLGKGQRGEVPAFIWTAMSLMTVLGLLGAVVFAVFSPMLVKNILNIPSELQHETLMSFYILAVSIPIVIGSTGLRGVLEAHQHFRLIAIVRIFLGIFTFLGPVIVLSFTDRLEMIVSVLVISRLLSWSVYAFLCFYVEPDLRGKIRIQRSLIKPLISFGGWMTISNVIGPLLVYIDRFVIGAMLSVEAVAYYATPYDVVTKLWIIPGALMRVMFPAFTVTLQHHPGYTEYLFSRSVKYLFLVLFPIVLVVVTFSEEALLIWLGVDFAENSHLVLQLITIGVFINSLANTPFALLQSAGRPDITAKIHMFEVPFYLLLLWWLVNDFGIVGAAFAWLIRVVVDTIILFYAARRLVLQTPASSYVKPLIVFVVALIVLAVAIAITAR